MKKITVFILTIFTIATLFAAARPSLDGRAVVADSGTMPRGLFARTVGYLPGDSVTVTNPATGTTADVLVLGAIDPSEGVAILLSPEAADALRISPNSNVQVKLTKRSGSLDENATGSAVLSDEIEAQNVATGANADEVPAVESPETGKTEVAEKSSVPEREEPVQSNAETSVAETEETSVPAEASAVEEIAVAAETNTASEEVNSENLAKETSSVPVEEPVEVPAAEEAVSQVAETVPSVEETVVPAAEAVSSTEPAVPAAVAESTPETIQPVILVEKEAEEPKSEPIILEPVEEELPALTKDRPETETLQPVIIVETESPVTEEPVSAADVSEEVVEAETNSEPEEEPLVPSEEVAAAETEIEAKAEVTEEAVAEEVAIESTSANDDGITSEYLPDFVEREPEVVVEDAEPYQPIVLVPAEPNPPVAEEKNEPVKEEAPAPVVEQPEPVPLKKEAVAAAPKPVVSNDWTNYVVPSHNNLVKGYYYIQIASLGNVENIRNIIKKYGSKYPVVLIQSTNGRTYQVLVGPLNIDEYGSVLAKFKAYGYKDAFVKRIK